MNAIASFWKSERGILAIALIVAATVLAALAVITADQWLDYSKWIFVTYVAGKSFTGAVDAMVNKKTKAPKAGDPS